MDSDLDINAQELQKKMGFKDAEWHKAGNEYLCLCESGFYGLKVSEYSSSEDLQQIDKEVEGDIITELRASKIRKFIVGAQKFRPEKFVVESNGELNIEAYESAKGFNSKYRLSNNSKEDFRHIADFERVKPLKKFKKGEVEVKKHNSGPVEFEFKEYGFSFLLL